MLECEIVVMEDGYKEMGGVLRVEKRESSSHLPVKILYKVDFEMEYDFVSYGQH